MIYLLSHLLDTAAARAPSTVAIACGESEMTYASLLAQANALASHLVRVGVAPGDRVAILMPKTPDSIVALFGVLKAGAAYVPLDPDSPAQRWSFIMGNCRCSCLIVAAECLERLTRERWNPPTSCIAIVCAGAVNRSSADRHSSTPIHSWIDATKENCEPPQEHISENALAYILYTSGSTGRPKGVMITHRASLSFIEWAAAKFDLQSTDRVTSHAPLHFDLSTFDIFATISAAATVVLVPKAVAPYPVLLAELLARERITVTYLVPSALVRLVLYGKLRNADLSALRCILFAGEVFPMKYLSQLMTELPRPRYFNLYGPTETNVCTYYEVAPEDVAAGGRGNLPIGVACENMQVFAVTEQGARITRPGEMGELYVSGPRVAAGYWDDPASTARGFIPNPYICEYLDRTYKTGDFVRLADDGRNWHFLFRRDHMVKTRGYRVELTEIEACLDAHPLVERAAVIARPDDLIGAALCAFVMPKRDGTSLSSRELREHCARILPGYMIPESFEVLEEMPLTSSGKIDRAGLANLPIPDPASSTTAGA